MLLVGPLFYVCSHPSGGRFAHGNCVRCGRCCFWYGTPLKLRPLRQEAVHSLWSRLFCGPLKMRRVPEKAVFGTECF